MPPEETLGAPAAAPAAIVEPTLPVSPEAAASVPAAVPSAPAAAPAEPAAAPVEAAEKPALVAHTETPGLLSSAEPAAADPAKPEADKTIDPAAPPDGEAPAPAIEPIKYEFTFPEGVKLEEEKFGEFTKLASEASLPPEAAQKLVDMHIGAMQAYADQTLAEQHRVFGDMRAQWRRDSMADEQLGGSGFDTNRAAAIRMLHEFVPPDRRAAFDQHLMLTGMTDSPEFFRFLVNIARKFDEPVSAPLPRNPAPDRGGKPGSRHGGFYDSPPAAR